MAKKAAAPVHVHLPEGSVVVYAVGDEISAAHQKLISNPNVFEADSGSTDSAKTEK